LPTLAVSVKTRDGMAECIGYFESRRAERREPAAG
jgi:hypothetical protein